MTNTYKTLNPLGSNNARDLSDNASNFDEYMNSDLPSIKDRFDKRRETLAGNQVAFDDAQKGRAQEFTDSQAERESEFNADQSERDAAFQAFLEGAGWSSIGAYGAGVVITSHTQTVDYLGQPYQLKPSIPVSISNPYTVTGNWAAESQNFKLVGDNSLRQDLSSPEGLSLSGFIQEGEGAVRRTGLEKARDIVSVFDFGLIADGVLRTAQDWLVPHALGRFATFDQLKAEYPFVTSLDESIDYIAFQAALDYKAANPSKVSGIAFSGHSVLNRELIDRSPGSWDGECRSDIRADWRERQDNIVDGTIIRFVGDGSICKTVKTRRKYRGSRLDPQDDPISAGINIQSNGVVLNKTFTVVCDFDWQLIQSDPGTLVPAIPATLDSSGLGIAPNFYGAPEVRIPTYWGANYDVGVFIGMRTDCVVNCDVVGGFRKHAVLVSSADDKSLPRLKDWRGNPYPKINTNGADGFTADEFRTFGCGSGISMLGGSPFNQLTDYGKNYKEYIQVTFSSSPQSGDRVLIGRRTGLKCGFEFVSPVAGRYPSASVPGDYAVRIRTTLAETMMEFVNTVQNASIDYSFKGDTSLGIHIVWSTIFDGSSVYLVAKTPDASSFKDLVGGSVVTGASRIVMSNGGAPTAVTNFKPYFWADSSTPDSELAGIGFGDGSYADGRGSYGMSDVFISNGSLRGIRRGSMVLAQISKERDRFADQEKGACIRRDGLAGNSSGKMQKCFIQSCRVGFSGYVTALQFGMCNQTTVDNAVSDESESVPDWHSQSVNHYGWWMETRRNGVGLMRVRNGQGISTPSPLQTAINAYTIISALSIGVRAVNFTIDGESVIRNYKTGEHIPRLYGATTPGVNMYTTQNLGFYEVVGDICTYTFRLSMKKVDPLMSGTILMSLPIPVHVHSSSTGGMSFGLLTGINLSAGTQLAGRAINGTSDAGFSEVSNTGTTTISIASKFTDNTDIRGVLVYRCTP